ncbi:hypothetical protein DFH08DRAFT_808957 [Mycena albidolilacea]|uniref:Uncharacterized protein n=1 Tax=Mycena albidolilacea TaxID=1033008 RepID=A0AAD7ER93_9AGAR|nr:hypothetical protein DFH08DRAFT_808957 [Mycena albidolilacea]
MDFDPNFTLSHMKKGFRIFAFEESLSGIPVRRLKISGPSPGLMTVFLDAQVLHPGEFDRSVNVIVTTETEDDCQRGLLIVLQKTQMNVPLLICCSSEFLLQALVKDREKFENNMLDAKFCLLKAVFAMLNERVAQIQFKKVVDNHAKSLSTEQIRTTQVDTEIDVMFECPGVLLSQGSQRYFTKIIRKLQTKTLNLDHI